MARGSIVERSGGYTIRYDVGLVWDEKQKAHIRKQKTEKVPWKKRENKVAKKIEWVNRFGYRRSGGHLK